MGIRERLLEKDELIFALPFTVMFSINNWKLLITELMYSIYVYNDNLIDVALK